MIELLEKCELCPRNCRVNRLKGELGYCRSGTGIKVARSAPHYWEEPCISGDKGSGAVFFSNCNLKCVFCQNFQISKMGIGEDITIEQLSELFTVHLKSSVHNLNLITPTHYLPQIMEAIEITKHCGISKPIIYNCGGYEKKESVKLASKFSDVFLPDLKYFSDKYSVKYSYAENYFKFAKESIEEMVKNTGPVQFDSEGMIQKGTIVRHMMLPGLLFDSKKILDYLHSEFGDDIYISIMNQYTPIESNDIPLEINRKVSWEYYNCLLDYALQIGIKNAYIQDKETAKESFIPAFFNKITDL